MTVCPAPVDDPTRLAALDAYAILDTPRERDFDEIAQLASAICGTSIAVVNLIGEGRQFFKAEVGLGVRETPLDSSFCAKAILEEDFLLIPDATKDARFRNNPLVVGEPHLRFYAGALLKTSEGHAIGTVCVLDHQPRELTDVQQQTLRVLARQVMKQLELRRTLRERRAEELRHRQILDSARDYAIISFGLDGLVTSWNTGAARILGWSEAEVLGKPGALIFTPQDRVAGTPEKEMAGAREKGRASDERWHLRKSGDTFWAVGEMVPMTDEAGALVGYLKILRDRTEDRRREERLTLLARASAGLLSATEPERLLKGVIEAGANTLGIDTGYIYALTQDGQCLDLTHSTGVDWESQQALRNVSLEIPLCGIVAQMVQPLVLTDVQASTEPRYQIARDAGVNAYAGFPIVSRGALRGVISYTASRKAGFDEETLDFFSTLTRLLATARERLDVESAMRAVEARLSDAIDIARLGTFTWDATAGVVELDTRSRAMLGLPTEGAVRQEDVFARIAPDEFERVLGQVQAGLAAGSRIEVDYPVVWPDGTRRAVRSLGDVVTVAGGERHMIGVLLDITDLKRAEALLRDANMTLEGRVEERTRERDRAWSLSQDLLVVAGTDGTLEAVNAAWTRALGWTSSELCGTHFALYTHPDDLEATLAAFTDIIERPLTEPYVYRLLHKDGTPRWFAWTGAFEDGKVYASGRDVTHDREREAVLRDARDFVRLALSAVGGVGVWTYEVASDLFVYDDAIANLYAIDPARGAGGIPRAEFLANVHPDDLPNLRATMAGGLVRSGDLELEYRIQHPDGSVRWVLSRGHTYHDEDGRPVRRTGVGVDTTRQRQTEEALRQAQKMEAVGQLTGGLAHDFNNLLAGISGSLELMQTRMSQGRLGDLDRYMTVAQGATKRAAALTHRLLAFSRRQTLDPKPTNVNRLMTDMEELIRRTIGPEIALEVVGASGAWPALIDPGQLENALLNLCINARDAMPEGGRITIETANKWLDEQAGRKHDMPPGQYLSVCVTDTGTGMSPDLVAKVFEPFFTTKPIGQGTGLGLSMVYGFARQSGGQVRIYSEVGEGTTICLYLPRHYGETDENGVALKLAAMARAEQDETVLIVDDEPSVRMLVTEILEDLGYTAIEAADSMAGLKVLQSDVRIDLLVTDVGLPGGMNGRQMADAGRERRPGLKVLFITGYAENSIIGNGHLEPGMQILTKPFAMEALASRIKDLITSR